MSKGNKNSRAEQYAADAIAQGVPSSRVRKSARIEDDKNNQGVSDDLWEAANIMDGRC